MIFVENQTGSEYYKNKNLEHVDYYLSMFFHHNRIKKYIKFSNLINEYNDYIEEEVDILYSKLYINNHLDLNDFNSLPSLLQKNLLKRILLDFYQDNISRINDKHIDLIFDLIQTEKRNR